MDGASAFYRKQAEWGSLYRGEITAWHRHRARWVAERLGKPPKQVLELGAGGGQDAVALATRGYAVVAVEREPLLAAHIRQLAERYPEARVRVVEDDFYRVALPLEAFDAVTYWDGFGIGTDEEQRRLLRRVHRWLKPEGVALIEVFTPWHAARSAGWQMQVGQARRRYAFDAEGCRWLDEWSHNGESVTQSLRCYSPADLRLLLEGTGLRLAEIVPGGKMDYTTVRFIPQASLGEAMSYIAVLRVGPEAKEHAASPSPRLYD